VVTTQGVELGRIERLLETGANDVLVVRGDRERLIPYLQPEVVTSIDLEAGVLQVDWDPEF
jgi:16S rRNA processing protein RimM